MVAKPGQVQKETSELKQRIWFVIIGLLVFRFGSYVPVPGVNADVLREMFNSQSGNVMGMFNMFSGGALERASILAFEQFGYKTVMQVPRIEKITLNMGVGEAVDDKKVLENAVKDLTAISGQKPLITKVRKSVAGFTIREGYPIGCKVTLRGERMWEFLERLISIAMPRIRDFRGVNAKSFDGRGNYSMGVREQIIFPEIDFDKVDAIRGMDITITTSAKTDDEARALLTAFNFPFL